MSDEKEVSVRGGQGGLPELGLLDTVRDGPVRSTGSVLEEVAKLVGSRGRVFRDRGVRAGPVNQEDSDPDAYKQYQPPSRSIYQRVDELGGSPTAPLPLMSGPSPSMASTTLHGSV